MKRIYIVLIVLILGLPLYSQHCGNCEAGNIQAAVTKKEKIAVVLKENKRQDINSDYYLMYSWQKKPKMGMAVLFVDVFRKKDNKRADDVTVTTNAFMPSMRGSHDSGERLMKLNKKKSHVIDVNFMMPGEWEIEVNISKNSKQLFTGLVQAKI